MSIVFLSMFFFFLARVWGVAIYVWQLFRYNDVPLVEITLHLAHGACFVLCHEVRPEVLLIVGFASEHLV